MLLFTWLHRAIESQVTLQSVYYAAQNIGPPSMLQDEDKVYLSLNIIFPFIALF